MFGFLPRAGFRYCYLSFVLETLVHSSYDVIQNEYLGFFLELSSCIELTFEIAVIPRKKQQRIFSRNVIVRVSKFKTPHPRSSSLYIYSCGNHTSHI
jgi:hypothetical protein